MERSSVGLPLNFHAEYARAECSAPRKRQTGRTPQGSPLAQSAANGKRSASFSTRKTKLQSRVHRGRFTRHCLRFWSFSRRWRTTNNVVQDVLGNDKHIEKLSVPRERSVPSGPGALIDF